MTSPNRRAAITSALAACGSAIDASTGRAETRMRPTSTERDKQIIASLIEAVWRQGRLDELPRFWTANCVNHADPSPQKEGLEALRRYHENFARAFADFGSLDIHLDQQIAERGRVVTQMTTRALHKPTGRDVSLASIRIDRLEAGKIAEHWSVADMAGLMQQLA